MIRLSLLLFQTCAAALITIQLSVPTLAFKKTSNIDEFMVQNQRTRMRQNYVLQRALNNDMDDAELGVTYVTEPFDPNANTEELPAFIVDYANMIRNDIILLDNSVETRTRRGNIKREQYGQGDGKDIPCSCEEETITVLKRKRNTDEESQDELPDDLMKRWVAVKKLVTVGCMCIRDYTD
ncbi:prothoracicotropic hormone-like [Vanessa cardui]|uniref:prothoracicotropic hormone-like n=1 Tax=Vanessa cardui TaxID=171605 RepID=UPI001F13F3A9|nr:prothoracicotropic hormone-like [Vanessa cardui]